MTQVKEIKQINHYIHLYNWIRDKDMKKLDINTKYKSTDLTLILEKVRNNYNNAIKKMYKWIEELNKAIKYYNEGIEIYNLWFGGYGGGHPDNFKAIYSTKRKTVKRKPNYHKISTLKKWIKEMNEANPNHYKYEHLVY